MSIDQMPAVLFTEKSNVVTVLLKTVTFQNKKQIRQQQKSLMLFLRHFFFVGVAAYCLHSHSFLSFQSVFHRKCSQSERLSQSRGLRILALSKTYCQIHLVRRNSVIPEQPSQHGGQRGSTSRSSRERQPGGKNNCLSAQRCGSFL